jgi:hypothetical protein
MFEGQCGNSTPRSSCYCTATLRETVWLSEPAVAVTVTVVVPVGVPGSVVPPPPPLPPPPEPLEPPPQPNKLAATPSVISTTNQRIRLPLGRKVRISIARPAKAASPVKLERSLPELFITLGAVVEIVKTVVAALPLGVTVEGANVQLASDGRPEQAKLTC